MKLTIQRSKWYRGNSSVGSRLLRSDGQMCCLGFLGKACGAEDKDILEVSSPSGIYGVKWPLKLFYREIISLHLSDVCYKLMRVNDFHAEWSELEREAELVELFKTIDVDVEFVD